MLMYHNVCMEGSGMRIFEIMYVVKYIEAYLKFRIFLSNVSSIDVQVSGETARKLPHP